MSETMAADARRKCRKGNGPLLAISRSGAHKHTPKNAAKRNVFYTCAQESPKHVERVRGMVTIDYGKNVIKSVANSGLLSLRGDLS